MHQQVEMDQHTVTLLRRAGGDALVEEVELFIARVTRQIQQYRERLGRVEWVCGYCGMLNIEVDRCKGCGAPRPEESTVMSHGPQLPQPHKSWFFTGGI